jgi:hypothetical protein
MSIGEELTHSVRSTIQDDSTSPISHRSPMIGPENMPRGGACAATVRSHDEVSGSHPEGGPAGALGRGNREAMPNASLELRTTGVAVARLAGSQPVADAATSSAGYATTSGNHTRKTDTNAANSGTPT